MRIFLQPSSKFTFRFRFIFGFGFIEKVRFCLCDSENQDFDSKNAIFESVCAPDFRNFTIGMNVESLVPSKSSHQNV